MRSLGMVLCLMLPMAASPLWAQCGFDELLPPTFDEQPQAYFGRAVSTDGATVVVGAPFFDDDSLAPAGIRVGRTYVYESVGGSWNLAALLDPADRASGDYVGFSVAVDGDLVAVGAPRDDDSDPLNGDADSGACYVFRRDGGGAWNEEAKLVAPSLGNGDELGTAVATDGGRIVVGAWGDDAGGTNAGAVHVFGPGGVPGTWVVEATLLASDGQAGDELGRAVAVSGDTVVVGAPRAGGTGAAYVYVFDGAIWTEEAVLLSDAPAVGDDFGTAVGIDGDRVVVGAPAASDGGVASGLAFAFERVGGAWSAATRVLPIDARADMEFGASVDVRGTDALVGAPGDAFDFVAGQATGSACLYVFTDAIPPDPVGATWRPSLKLSAADVLDGERYGASVSLGGGVAAVGTPRHTDGSDGSVNIEAGAAQVHALGADEGPGGPNGIADYVDVATGQLTNANGNCAPDELETGIDPDFDVVEYCAGDPDGPTFGPGQEAYPRGTLEVYIAATKPGRPRLSFDEVPGENGVACDGLFGHTFTDVTSGALAATLEIGLRASTTCSSPNTDFLALELGGGSTFAWQRALEELPTTPGGVPLGSWSGGDYAVFTLDLSDLPLAGGGSADLLTELLDGDLDVVVGDHTGVDFVCLTVEVFQPVRQYIVRYDAGGGLTHGAIEAQLAGLPEFVDFVDPDAAIDAFFAHFNVLATKDLEDAIEADGTLEPVVQSVERVPLVGAPTAAAAASGGGTAGCAPITLPNAFQRMRTNKLHAQGVDGDFNPIAPVRVGMLDWHAPAHVDLCGRLTVADDIVQISDHATRVAGILAGDGFMSGGVNHGVAPDALLYSWSRQPRFDLGLFEVVPGYVLPLSAPSPGTQWKRGIDIYGVDVFNNSWGYIDQTGACKNYGRYTLDCPQSDTVVSRSHKTIVFAAGNERTPKNEQGGCSLYPWQTVLPSSSAKNIITVGAAIADTPVRVFDKSSFGPTADGRLKPDVVAIAGNYLKDQLTRSPGEVVCDLFPYDPESLTWVFPPDPTKQKCIDCTPDYLPPACDNYSSYNDKVAGGATSWATPQVTGLAALLVDRHRAMYDADPTGFATMDPIPALVKALILNNAKDLRNLPIPGIPILGPDHHTIGPDYQTGYGLVDAARAHHALVKNQWYVGQIDDGQIRSFEFIVQPHGQAPIFTGNELSLVATAEGRGGADGGRRSGDVVLRDPQPPAESSSWHTFPVMATGTCTLDVMIAWSDPPCVLGTPVGTDPTLTGGPFYDKCHDDALVNDLDLSLMDPNGAVRHFPWTLNPDKPEFGAKRTVNRRDNVEQVTIENPLPGSWSIDIWGWEVDQSQGPQTFALTWSYSCTNKVHTLGKGTSAHAKAAAPGL